MTRRAYGCRLNRPAAPRPADVLRADILTAGLSAEVLAQRSGIPEEVIGALLSGDRLPTPRDSERIAPFLGREKRYYHKRAIEWREENA